MAEEDPLSHLTAIDADECSAHRMARLGTFAIEVAVALVLWSVVARVTSLAAVPVVLGAPVAAFVAVVAGTVLGSGTPVRRLVGLRVVDVGTLGPPPPARAAAHEVVRLLTLVTGDTLLAGGGARTYDARQRRWARTVVVGRPTWARMLAVVGLAVLTSVVAWAMTVGAPDDAGWVVPLVPAIGLGALGAAVGLAAVMGLAALPPPPGERVSRVTVSGEWVGVDPDLSLGLTGVRVAGSLDAKPVPRPRADGTVADEALTSSSGIVTRKHRTVGQVEGP